MNRTGLLISTILILVALAYIGCNNGNSMVVPPPGTVAKYVSADICVTCHVSEGSEWEHTAHERGFEDLMSSDHWSESCLSCMSTGWDENPANSGIDDPNPVVADKFAGVQCEACHGVGSTHVATFEPYDTVGILDSAICGECHTGSRHGVYAEWAASAHGSSIDVPHDNERVSCLRCRSTDYMADDNVPEDATVFDYQFSITCVECHDPHSDEHEGQLRASVTEICHECHTAGGAKPGSNPHHNQGDVFTGSGGYEYDGGTYENSAHTYMPDGCAACHFFTAPYDATGEGEAAIHGHDLQPKLEACLECHPGLTSFDRDGTQTEIAALLEELNIELEAATDNDKLTLSYERALFNHHFAEVDKSHGVHNLPYTRALLQDAIDDFEPGS